ncbi:MAG: hypothetical protein AB1560_02635 [Pseudomonadota bacterium]
MPDPSRPARRVLLALGLVAPVLFLAALILSSFLHRYAPALVHMILAAGIMPLIMAAMIYFTPVLTHSRAPSWPVLALPVLALIAGAAAAAAIYWRRDLIMVPALTAMFTAAALFGWIGWRARAMLGRPHPGLHWYQLALASLLLGLLAISIAAFWPEHWAALRRFHLHMNIYGFIGLTAVGTLRVLLPTVAGYNDAATRVRLQRDLYPMALGALLMAAGSAWWAWLVWPGLALWLVPLGRFAAPLVTTWRQPVWGWHRPATSLALAVAGLMLVLLAGGLHAAGVLPADIALPLFFYLFLFPLVTGAVSYLLPVWIWPARNTAAHASAVRRLAWGSGARVLGFFLAGGMAWAGLPGAVHLAGAVMAVFLALAIWALSARFSATD